jgi:hypothetical protein
MRQAPDEEQFIMRQSSKIKRAANGKTGGASTLYFSLVDQAM